MKAAFFYLLNFFLLPCLFSCEDSEKSEVLEIKNSLSENVQGKNRTITALSFNIWKGGGHYPNGLSSVVHFIRQSLADIVLLQEQTSKAQKIAQMTKMNYVVYGDSSVAILSKYKIGKTQNLGRGLLAEIKHPLGAVTILNMHLSASAYGPYELCYKGKSPKKVMKMERETRLFPLMSYLEQLDLFLDENENSSILVGGDFNSPSHLDWTEETRDKHCGHAFSYPVTQELEKKGLIDSFRQFLPNPITHPGITWSPVEKYNKHYQREEAQDRIDFLFYKGQKLTLIKSEVFPSHDQLSDWPSDHYAIKSTFRFEETPAVNSFESHY